MRILALLGLLPAWSAAAAPPPATLFDDLVEVTPGQARSLAVPAQQGPARIASSFRVLGGGEARLLLIPAESMDAWVEGKAYEELAATGYGRSGTLTHVARAPRELVLVVQSRNGSRRPLRLNLLVRVLDPAAPFPPLPRPADRRRGEILVWSSLGIFAAIAGGGAVRLHRLFAARR
jgi:hypothetical protein